MWELVNGTVVNPESAESANVLIDGNKISSVHSVDRKKASLQADVGGMLILPGLIDCHDHLLGTYFPRVGDRRPYLNWLEWDNDLKSAAVYAERQLIDSNELYLMGGFRHLLCGITSVQDHIPHFVRQLFAKDLPVRLIDQYALAHSVGSFALSWGEGIEAEHALAQEKKLPFITHCSEGFDAESRNSVPVLAKKGALSRHTVLIHGIAFSDSDIELLAKNQCNVVWCPVSNLYMFERTAPVRKLLDAGVNVVLGTDSPMSGSINLFEELAIARAWYQHTYDQDIPARTLFEMLTSRAAKAMWISDRGHVKRDHMADIVVIKPSHADPYESFMRMDYASVQLVVIDGVPRYGAPEFQPLFDSLDAGYHKVRVDGMPRLIQGDVYGLLRRVRESVGFHKELPFLPVEAGA